VDNKLELETGVIDAIDAVKTVYDELSEECRAEFSLATFRRLVAKGLTLGV